MAETKDLAQLRRLNLELLRQLWAGQDAVRRSVARAASKCKTEALGGRDRTGALLRLEEDKDQDSWCPEQVAVSGQWPGGHLGDLACLLQSNLDSSCHFESETPPSSETTPSLKTPPFPESSSTSSRASSSQDKSHMCDPLDSHQGNTHDTSWCGRASSSVDSLPPVTYQHPEPLGGQRPHSAPSPPIEGLKEPVPSGGAKDLGPQETEGLRSSLSRQRKASKPRVTFFQESMMPESSWRLWPYLGYDWIAGSLDNRSQVTSEPEAFFSTLQKFRETNKEDCVCSSPEAVFPGLQDSSGMEEGHQCEYRLPASPVVIHLYSAWAYPPSQGVYCYRINRRLFPVPVDPGAPCHLCGIPRGQRDNESLVNPAQVRVSMPVSILDPPHRYRIHRRKSFDASDTLALPQHCLLGWDTFPPKSEKSSASKSLDLWSSVHELQSQHLSAATPSRLALPARVPPPTLIWSEPLVPQLHNLH
ncbi:migration and invasion-inhibitory protein isoform X2 [Nannospalax galili]|uniref:migration and invasion-inhibitory protein isoform X2 n=1 Tax=Nannospalax galili TaxID=1026970 RepID=UPI00111BE1FD|nr:migration and invasion-inhibitory protein isoform X2 [Nannospalax galili]